jgi:hypothetical protein
MILALLWLTVSAPFVIAGQQELSNYERMTDTGPSSASTDDETANPFGNNTEEKSPSSSNFSEEYIHDHHKSDRFFSTISRIHNCENADTYIAYHGELLVPPPDVA